MTFVIRRFAGQGYRVDPTTCTELTHTCRAILHRGLEQIKSSEQAARTGKPVQIVVELQADRWWRRRQSVTADVTVTDCGDGTYAYQVECK